MMMDGWMDDEYDGDGYCDGNDKGDDDYYYDDGL